MGLLSYFNHSSKTNRLFSRTIQLYSSSCDFVPPDPPPFQGAPIFPNVNLKSISKDAKIRNDDPDAVFVVTGANRGIGHQIVNHLLLNTKGTIVACYRTTNYDNNDNWINQDRIHAFDNFDLEQQDSIERLQQTLQQTYNRVDVLYNVAGILGNNTPNAPGPERSLQQLDRDWAMRSMQVNYLGPTFLTQALAPMMRSTVRKENRPTSVVANISARVGSISDNGLGGWLSYRCSKAALNQATRTMAHELKRQGTLCISLHPGTTDTDLSKPFSKNVKAERLFPVEFTAERMINVVDAIEDVHTGGFYDWSGQALSF
jgi:NAD(P)-dependent dehydrogenase (short-subunit alcohol dehydrogenase family)